MNAKKVVGFLVCKDAFTQRNISSVLLVAVFFGVYVFAGGKVTTSIPELRGAAGLGATDLPGRARLPNPAEADKIPTPEESKAILGLSDSKERAERENRQTNRYKLFTEEDAKELESDPIDPKGLIKGAQFGPSRREQLKIEKQEKKQTDQLSEIEERLKKRSLYNY